mgnify:CR=1 FL=1
MLFSKQFLTKAAPRLAACKRVSQRHLSFSFAGPRSLDEIIKKDMLANKTGSEIADIWYTYHEARENVLGLVYKGKDANAIISRAKSWYACT